MPFLSCSQLVIDFSEDCKLFPFVYIIAVWESELTEAKKPWPFLLHGLLVRTLLGCLTENFDPLQLVVSFLVTCSLHTSERPSHGLCTLIVI